MDCSGLVAVALFTRMPEGGILGSKPQVARTSPCDTRPYDDLKVRFSATVGEEPEVELSWSSG
jgi:hypothetical protein